jgi:hypothetical protein
MTKGVPPIPGFVMPDGNWLLALAGGQNQAVNPGLTASTTQTQAAGTDLAYGLNSVTSVANASDAMTIPPAKSGCVVVMANNGGNALSLFPASGDAINDAAADAAVSVTDNTLSVYACMTDGTWFGGAITFET